MTTSYITQWKRFERALAVRGHGYQELMAVTGWSRPTVKKHIDQMREERQVFIEGYGKDSRGRAIVPLFRMGKEKDADRPPHQTSTARVRRLREARDAERKHHIKLLKKHGLL